MVEQKSIEKAQGLLKRLFRSENADLDFGIYRIMNFKRAQIEKFIDTELVKAVESEFKEFAKVGTKELEIKIGRLKAEINGVIPGTIDDDWNVLGNQSSPKVQEFLKAVTEFKEASVSEEQLQDVFNHIFEFFSRYYEDGDFIPKTRYGGREKYFLPYNGEEVLAHWATSDMYYVKTGEYFNKYSFVAGKFQINFALTEAQIELGNVKGANRYFALSAVDPVALDEASKMIEIRFNYRGLTENEEEHKTRNVQGELIEKAIAKIESILGVDSFPGLLRPKYGEDKSLVRKHLEAYVQRNTKDFFIHKDLKSFLMRELDFYLKNEVLHIDDVGYKLENMPFITAKARVIQEISSKIIEFLTQIEDFQRHMFEKKKFVLRTDYCFTLDFIPEEFYKEIGENRKQVSAWKKLYGLDEITNGSFDCTKGKLTLDPDFLKNHKFMMLDTRFFEEETKLKFLETFEDIDGQLNGLLIKSDNIHALRLLNNKLYDKIDCIYVDPPYNTGSTKIIYKNEYEHSSWMTMVFDRIHEGLELLKLGGVFEIAIDDYEGHRLRYVMDNLLGEANRLGTIAILHNPGGRHDDKFVATSHEYLLIYSTDKTKAVTYDLPLSQEDKDSFKFEDNLGKYRLREFRRSGSHSTRHDRPNMWYPIYYDPVKDEISIDVKKDGMAEILPIDPKGIERVWRWGKATASAKISRLIVERKGTEYTVKAKLYLNEKTGNKPKSLWTKSAYSSALGTMLLKDIIGVEGAFSYPKSLDLVCDSLRIACSNNQTILDYFAGSGTTAHAVMKLNREEKRNLKFILVEMGDYFDTVLKPRIERITFSKEWRNGFPETRDGITNFFKYQYLEQYEDTLNNIEFRQLDGSVQSRLDRLQDYFVRYMLDYETKGSPARLSFEQFKNPFNYKIKTINGGVEKEEQIDLVETFNYLLGLSVRKIRSYKDGDRLYLAVFGERGNEQIAIIWRSILNLDLKADKSFIEGIILKDAEVDAVYINGDSYLENATPIEPEFKSLMGA